MLTLALAGNMIVSGQVRARLYAGEKVNGVVIRVVSGNYDLSTDGNIVKRVVPEDSFFIARESRGIAVTNGGGNGFITGEVILAPLSDSSLFEIRQTVPGERYVSFNGTLQILHDMGTLIVINETPLESYVAAVVEAEGGYNGHPQYYMAQAILVRTFAVMNMQRHADEGYDLCDDVHCQVYHGVCRDPVILSSVAVTRGLVVTDTDTTLVFAPFHSNCGGMTAPSDHSWLRSEHHLLSVTDPYCSLSRNATWQKTVTVDEWISALRANGYTDTDSAIPFKISNPSRTKTITAAGQEIPLSGIRNFIGLRSSYFSADRDGDRLILSGRGYGHGVGLCQEGAMEMAKRGFSFYDIITFYYRDILITGVGNAKRPASINSLF